MTPHILRPMELSPDQKIAGILTPLFALRSENDLGIGDIGTLREFIDWSAEYGFRVVQLLPINETGNDNSPYNAISSVALDPATIEINCHTVPDLREADLREVLSGVDLDSLRKGSVNYPVVKELKRNLLRRAFERFTADHWELDDGRARKFQKFIQIEAAWIESYALFRVLIDRNGVGECWDMWPAEQQSAVATRAWLASLHTPERMAFEDEMRFVMFIQWIAFSQWREIKRYAESRGVVLMGDVPFGVSYYSADVFADPGIFDLQWSGGAPPEPLFRDDPFTVKWGQNWGVPLYHWEVLKARRLDWWRQRVSKVREIFHLFRIDHVLGFYRIYGFPWRPQRNGEFLEMTKDEAKAVTGGLLPHFHEFDDDTPEHCEANRANGEARLTPLIEEVGQYRLIGEDLGTVPKYVRPSLASLGIAGFKVPQWETRWDTHLIPGSEYQRLSIATFATHDHEPLRVQWERWMAIIERAEHEDSKPVLEARDWTWWEVRRMSAWAGFEVPCITPFEEVHEKLLGGLFACNSWIAVCMITDVFGSTQRFNVPGAVSDSNWSQRLAGTVGSWREDRGISEKMQRIHDLIVEAGRGK